MESHRTLFVLRSQYVLFGGVGNGRSWAKSSHSTFQNRPPMIGWISPSIPSCHDGGACFTLCTNGEWNHGRRSRKGWSRQPWEWVRDCSARIWINPNLFQSVFCSRFQRNNADYVCRHTSWGNPSLSYVYDNDDRECVIACAVNSRSTQEKSRISQTRISESLKWRASRLPTMGLRTAVAWQNHAVQPMLVARLIFQLTKLLQNLLRPSSCPMSVRTC